nr:hypothetical protein [Actinopolyspora righensis]
MSASSNSRILGQFGSMAAFQNRHRAAQTEFRQRTSHGDEGKQQLEIERVEFGECGHAPRKVQRGKPRILKHPEAEQRLVQWRDDEARVRQILDPQYETDH